MTTIVCNRSGMAADKKASGMPNFRVTKLFRVNGSIIGTAGTCEHALRFIEWRRTPEQKPVFNESANFCAIELTPDGVIKWWGPDMVAVTVEEEFYAVGSGAPIALGALSMGASLRDSVKIAARWDEYTGTEIQTMTLKGK